MSRPMTDKARAFHAMQAALRKLPGNCGRCGKPNSNGFKQCDRCRAYQKRYKAELTGNKLLTVPQEFAKAMEQFRRELNAIRRTVKVMANARRESYLRGFMAGQINRRRNRNKHLAKYLDAYPTITKQELATMNHAYAALDTGAGVR